MSQSKTSRSPWLKALLVGIALGMIGCQTNSAPQAKHYPITGTVSAIDAEQKAITLNHDAIPGFMQAMEMEFAVADPQLLQSIAEGDQVQGELTVGADGSMITKLKKQPND